MPSESEIHDLLARFGPRIIDVLDSVDFWAIEGTYDPAEIDTKIKHQPEYKKYKQESEKKNSRIWDIVAKIIVPAALLAGMQKTATKYDLPKPTVQDYSDAFVKKYGGQFITGMSRADQKTLTRFIWKNSLQNERPLAKHILKNEPLLGYLVDNKEYRLRAIKRTESGRADSYGAFRWAGDSGLTEKHRMTAGDKRVRDKHREDASAGWIDIDERYPSSGELFAGENSINCRCDDEFR